MEWKDANAEFGAVFLGAQVAAKVVFLADVQVCSLVFCLRGWLLTVMIQGGSNKGFMSRSDYNEQGPSAIAEFSL